MCENVSIPIADFSEQTSSISIFHQTKVLPAEASGIIRFYVSAF